MKCLLNNCTFFGNRSPDGAALYLGQESLATVKNCILWDDANEISHVDGASIDIACSNIRNRYPDKNNIAIEPWSRARANGFT